MVKYVLDQNSVGWFTSYLFSSSQQWLYIVKSPNPVEGDELRVDFTEKAHVL